jgi:hypothetical protein
MPKFSIKDLLIVTAMIAVGLTGVLLSFSSTWDLAPYDTYLAQICLFAFGSAMIGGGVLRLYKRVAMGMLLGVVIGFALLGVIGAVITID